MAPDPSVPRPDAPAARDPVWSIAEDSLAQGEAVAWMEQAYDRAGGDPAAIPWCDLHPNPSLIAWLDERTVGNHARALVVGCGLGDDAEMMAARGYRVTAFDVSDTAVEWAQRRFSASAVDYVVADVLAPPAAWRGAFELVVEIYTLQVLPADVREVAMDRLAETVALGGHLYVLARGRDDDAAPGRIPWPLSRAELAGFTRRGFAEQSVRRFRDEQGVDRIEAIYTRVA